MGVVVVVVVGVVVVVVVGVVVVVVVVVLNYINFSRQLMFFVTFYFSLFYG